MSDNQSAFDLARRIEARGAQDYSWLVVTTQELVQNEALDELCSEIQAVTGIGARALHQKTPDLEVLRAWVSDPPDDVCVFSCPRWSKDEWRVLDINRSALERRGALILWLLTADLIHFAEGAPNIRSYVGGSIFAWRPDGGIMDEEERTSRLAQLREHYRIGDEEFIERFRQGALGADPQLLEWAVLMGRGDLI